MHKMKRPWNNPINSLNGKLMPVPRGLTLLGIKLYPVEDSDSQKNKVFCMQKSLFGSNDWFYFYKGVKIKRNEDKRLEAKLPDGIFDPDFFLYRSHKLKDKDEQYKEKKFLQNININAIIGENGTGKSTLVDMVIRVLNNFSAAVFGEDYIYTSAQHLHYIENVHASLAVFIDDKVKILTVRGHNIIIDSLLCDYEQDDKRYMIYRQVGMSQWVLEGGKHHLPEEVLGGNNNMVSLMKEWFYSIVVNYSLYAYNFKDYKSERTCQEKINALISNMDGQPVDEDYYWLKGVFHKNDGYQTPIVVNPMRENGYINAQKENRLGKQNLISLTFVAVENHLNGDDWDVNFPFRVINQTHHIVSFEHHWGYDWMDDGNEILSKAESVFDIIKGFWKLQIFGQTDVVCQEESDAEKIAWLYVVYKTLKTLKNYIVYKDDWSFFLGHQIEVEGAADHLKNLMMDSTHRTRKLRRTLAFLKYHDSHYSVRKGRQDVDDIYEWMKSMVGKNLYETNDFHKIEVEDLLPPPCCYVSLGLVDNKHFETYKKEKEAYEDIIPFEGLSSGERQIAYSISSLMYHLINIDSTVDDKNPMAMETIHYEHANVMMDEVELYFHPDLQRRFVKLLVDSLNSMRWRYLQSVNVTLITHSPFVLSDIPMTNVLCLTREGVSPFYDRTFAANIHDLFNNTFVLPDTIGELAKTKIKELVDFYYQKKKELYLAERDDSSEVSWPSRSETEYFKYLINIVGDEYLQSELEDMWKELLDNYREIES